MTRRFEYGVTRIKDLKVATRLDSQGKSVVEAVELDGRAVRPSERFWKSLHVRFGFTRSAGVWNETATVRAAPCWPSPTPPPR